jgi:NADH-quinone oxidoreductase B subunit
MNAFTTRFDLERFGALTAEIPRKADILMVTGLINKNVAEVIRRIYDQMPEPKYVIALGACTMGGGPYHDSYSTIKDVSEIVPVDVYVPGCPIRAEAIIEGLRELQRKIYGKEVK